jgi:hypothetical protein
MSKKAVKEEIHEELESNKTLASSFPSNPFGGAYGKSKPDHKSGDKEPGVYSESDDLNLMPAH